MPAAHDRILAALELRKPDRVPTFDLMQEYANIYEILRKKPLPIAFLFSNPYIAKIMDKVVAQPWVDQSRPVDKAMKDYTYDRTAASAKMGYDSAWVGYHPVWRYLSSKVVRDIYGRCWDVTLDGKGNVGTPMYRRGLISSPSDWKDWNKKDLLCLPEKNYRMFSLVQKDFGNRLFVFATFTGGLFELTWQCMGFEPFCVAIRREKEFIRRMIGFYTDLYCIMLEAFAEAGVPGVMYPNDMAYRSGPMLNPKVFEELYGESLRRLTGTAHALDLKIVIHSCGNVYSLLPWFADCGFDGVHALEPTAGVELAQAKEIIGDRLCLIGNIDVTHILVSATKEEVFETVHRAIQDAGKAGGYILGPTNSHPGMTVRNLRWMVEAVEKYGRYPLTG